MPFFVMAYSRPLIFDVNSPSDMEAASTFVCTVGFLAK